MKNKIVLGFCSTPDFSGNAKALYEQLKERQLENYQLIWIVQSLEMKEKLQKMGIKVISYLDLEFDQEFKKIDIMFITHDQLIKKKLPTQTFISLWHGFGPKRTGFLTKEHAIYENEFSFAKEYADKIDYFITPSEFAKIVFLARYNCGIEKIKVYPYNRNRYLFENSKEKLEKITNRKIQDFKKIILYAPTFKKGIGREEGDFNTQNILNLEKYNEEKLIEYLEKENFLLILQMHPSEENKVHLPRNIKHIAYLNQEEMKQNLITTNEILGCMDILITDYSSIFTDFLLLDKPILFINNDYEKFKKDRGILFDCEEFWFPGPITNTIEGLIENIEIVKKSSSFYQQERRTLNKIINGGNELDFEAIIDKFILLLEPKIKIPKIIHYFARETYSKQQEKNIQEWKEKLIEYEFYEWGKNELKEIEKKYQTGDSEILTKIAILEEYGGVFLDINIQVLRDIEPLLFYDELIIKGNYNEGFQSIIGATKGNKYLLEFIKEKWLNIDKKGIKLYQYKDIFVRDDEQWRIGKTDFKDKDKFFNITRITLKNKIGRIIKYGLNIDNRNNKEEK